MQNHAKSNVKKIYITSTPVSEFSTPIDIASKILRDNPIDTAKGWCIIDSNRK